MRGLDRFLAAFDGKHLVGIAVIGGDDGQPLHVVHHFQQATDTGIHRFHSGNRGVNDAGVADHIAVGKINTAPAVFAGSQQFFRFFSNFERLHLGRFVKLDFIRRNFHKVFQFVVDIAGAIAVPEIGDVAVFLRFRERKRGHAAVAQVFGHRAIDLRRRDEKIVRNVQVAVVFHHAGIEHIRICFAIEFVKLFLFKGTRNFNGAVAAEIEIDHAIAVFDGAHWLALFIGNNKRRQVLIGDFGIFIIVGLYGFGGRTEGAGLTEHMRIPAAFDHAPVGIVTIHGGDHTTATGSDAIIDAVILVKSFEQHFGLFDIGQGRFFAHIAAIQQRMQAHPFHAFFGAILQQGVKLLDVRVHIAVGEQADEMERRGTLAAFDQIIPDFGVKDRFVFDGRIHQLGPLRKDTAGADGVVSHFAVAHVFIRGQAHGGTVRAQPRLQRPGHQFVQNRGFGQIDGIAVVVFAKADTIHNNQQERTFATRKRSEFFQLQGHMYLKRE